MLSDKVCQTETECKYYEMLTNHAVFYNLRLSNESLYNLVYSRAHIHICNVAWRIRRHTLNGSLYWSSCYYANEPCRFFLHPFPPLKFLAVTVWRINLLSVLSKYDTTQWKCKLIQLLFKLCVSSIESRQR